MVVTITSLPTMRERRRNTIIAFMSVAVVVPIVWMMEDRDPPYVRSDGDLVAVEPNNCGIPGPVQDQGRMLGPHSPIHAGECVEVKWTIKTLRNCPASGDKDNVTRSLRDAIGVTQPIGSLRRNIFEHESPQGITRQFMVLPAPLPAGPTLYKSSSCFACNPLQHLFWPICVSSPDITFEVVK